MLKIFATCLISALIGLPAARAESAKIDFATYGAVKIGMSQRDMETVLGFDLKDQNPADEDSESCRYVGSEAGAPGVMFMLIHAHLARIDVTSPSVRAVSGARIGMSQRNVVKLYRQKAVISPHAYTAPDGTYVTIHSPDGRYGIRFETDKGKVVTFYAGTSEAIEYIEGCL
ncbi:MAG TPA: hypothetical protein VGM81_24660 [Burkholderiaceae bacterium]|jgi:hypothetical protein